MLFGTLWGFFFSLFSLGAPFGDSLFRPGFLLGAPGPFWDHFWSPGGPVVTAWGVPCSGVGLLAATPLGPLAGPGLGPLISNTWTMDKFSKEILLFSLSKPSFFGLGRSRVILEPGWHAPVILAATPAGSPDWTIPGVPYFEYVDNGSRNTWLRRRRLTSNFLVSFIFEFHEME